MPPDWSRPLDVDRLVAGRSSFELRIPLLAMVRLQDRLAAATEESVRAQIVFVRELDTAVAEIVVEATVPLRCERCLRPMQWSVRSRSRLALVGDEREAARLDAGLEPVSVLQRKVRLLDLVEEEVLLGLPLIARHDRADRGCRPTPWDRMVITAADRDTERASMQRPFAELG
ncbi:MAG: YceD family protein, partial [Steroidobacteraceae bacterium]|nr:YceD family protein [Steroidobacteraceae bacterium]MDW8259641.1 YceD family protein [Gammaproteobacteria bacterium]